MSCSKPASGTKKFSSVPVFLKIFDSSTGTGCFVLSSLPSASSGINEREYSFPPSFSWEPFTRQVLPGVTDVFSSFVQRFVITEICGELSEKTTLSITMFSSALLDRCDGVKRMARSGMSAAPGALPLIIPFTPMYIVPKSRMFTPLPWRRDFRICCCKRIAECWIT